MTQVTEIQASDTFSAEPPPTVLAAAELVRLYNAEFLHEGTGERRVVSLEDPVSQGQAYAAAAPLRAPGEVVLQVVPRD